MSWEVERAKVWKAIIILEKRVKALELENLELNRELNKDLEYSAPFSRG